MTSALFLLALASCASLSPEDHALPLDRLAGVDVRGTARSTAVVLEHLRGRDRAQRDRMAASVRALQVTCPYHRASVQLPLALHAMVTRLGDEAVDPLVAQDWAYLQEGLATHVAILDELGAQLPLPVEGDYLHGRVFPDAPLTRTQLATREDPVLATMPLLASIRFVVDDYDPQTRALIEEHHAVVRAGTLDQWPLSEQVLGWRVALRKLRPFVVDEAAAARVDDMIQALEEYAGLSC